MFILRKIRSDTPQQNGHEINFLKIHTDCHI